jgi:hypothetical protein
MRKVTAGLFVMMTIALFSVSAESQPLPSGSRSTSSDGEAYRQIQRQRAMDNRNQAEMRRTEQAARESVRVPQEKFGKLTEKEKKKIEALRAPNPEDIAAYKDFLAQPNTGIVRLLPGYNCESKYVVRVDGNCVNMIPGSSFHRFRNDALSGDILYMDGALIAEGFFSNSIMTGLGNISLNDVSLSTSGMKFLTDFAPTADLPDVKKQYSEISKGIITGNYAYSNRLAAIPDMTYGLRIVAYRNGNNVMKRINRDRIMGIEPSADSKNVMFLALKEDTRIDLTLSFRIIRKDTDGSITLIWKELSRKDSPEIVFPDNAELADFK